MTDNASNDGNGTDVSPRDSSLAYERDEEESPSEAVVHAVATLTDTAAIDLDPLYDVIDPAHLDGILDGTGDGDARKERSVTFNFNGCKVTAYQDTIHVQAGVR